MCRNPEGHPSGGEYFIGKVWPRLVHFVDWTNPNATEYWTKEIHDFHANIPFDGLWIDMNEASNFCDGRCALNFTIDAHEDDQFSCLCDTQEESSFNDPPYMPGLTYDNRARKCVTIDNGLDCSSITMTATHHNGGIEYDMHSLFGHQEAVATNDALVTVRGERPFVLTRSTFAGTGGHAGHWLGDNNSFWSNLRVSVAGVLNMQIFGLPLVGADICGFAEKATPELCARFVRRCVLSYIAHHIMLPFTIIFQRPG